MGADSGRRPIRPTQRSRLWAMMLKIRPSCIRTEVPRGQVVEADTYFKSSDHVPDGSLSPAGTTPRAGSRRPTNEAPWRRT